MDTTKKTSRRRPTGAKAAVAVAVAPTEMLMDPFIDFKGSLEVLVRNLEHTVKHPQQPVGPSEEVLLMMAQKEEEMELKHEAHISELKNAFQVQESENNSSFIKTIEGLELALKRAQDTFKERVEEEIKAYMDVSLLNQYIKQIDALKKENDILTLKLDAKKKVLEKIQREHKELQLDMEILSLRSEAEQAEQADADAEEEEEEEEEEAKQADADAEEEEEEEGEEEAEQAEQADVQEVEVEVEVEVEIDVSKLDIIEVDDVEYYLDLDNNILDKNTLDILGTLTSDGDALFTNGV
jgi:hypothetical protein